MAMSCMFWVSKLRTRIPSGRLTDLLPPDRSIRNAAVEVTLASKALDLHFVGLRVNVQNCQFELHLPDSQENIYTCPPAMLRTNLLSERGFDTNIFKDML